jgi:Tfp pilus assembly protein PilF
MGYSYLREQQIQPAYVEFQKAAELNPKDRDTHYALGHIYFVQGNYGKAEREFRSVVKLDSRYAEAWNYLGKVYDEQGKTDLALEHFDRALSFPQYLTPDLAQYNKGKVFLKRRQPDQALRAFSAALRINPNHALAAFEAGKLYADQGALKEAIAAFEITVRELPDYAEAHYHLAKAYAQAGMNDEARTSYRRVVELAPGSPWAEDANNHLARLGK